MDLCNQWNQLNAEEAILVEDHNGSSMRPITILETSE